ncbi:MAG: ATP/GTP-binding protein [Nitrososphaerota archaeon]
MYSLYVLGTAGSGKSLLTHTLKSWMVSKEWYTITVNLDPGAESLPYDPDVDVRLYIDLHEIMDKYQLGPNGALVFASDMIATKVQELQDDIDSYNADYVIFDTPGQMELFAYRPSGQYLASNLVSDGKVLIYLYDAWLCRSPENFLALNLLASSVKLRFRLPFLSVLNKVDLAHDEYKQVMKWTTDTSLLSSAISETLKGEDYSLYFSLFKALERNSFITKLIPVSAATSQGFMDLSGKISMILRGGEESEA